METSILLFLTSAAFSGIFIYFVVIPLARIAVVILKASGEIVFTIGLLIISIPIAAALGFFVLSIYNAVYSNPESYHYKYFVFLTSMHASQIALGFFMGPILSYWLHFYSRRNPTQIDRSNHTRLTITICVITVFAIMLPYLHSWFSNMTAFEISQIVKINIGARQDAPSQAVSAVAGPLNSIVATEYKGEQILYEFDQVVDMADNKKNDGMISRDEGYIRIATRRESVESSYNYINGKDIYIYQTMDRIYIGQLSKLAQCLRAYAEEIKDYRLLLVDIKPLIVTLALVARLESNSKVPDLAKMLNSNINGLKKNVNDILQYRSSGVPSSCKIEGSVPEMAVEMSPLPYKTIALSYFLSAIGSDDTAVVQLAEWLDRKDSRLISPWYAQRVEIRISTLLERVLPSGTKNPVFRKFMENHVNTLRQLIPDYNLVLSSKDCDKLDKPELWLIFTYIVQVNRYVKSSSNFENISSDIIRMAERNRNTNIECFESLSNVGKEKDAWRADFMITYAYALIIRSYDETLFGRGDHPERRRIREVAKQDLYDAISILATFRSNNSKEQIRKEAKVSAARRIFTPADWEAQYVEAKSALRLITNTP